MTHKDIYDKFKVEYDKAAATSSYPSLTDYEIAAILDKAYLALIAQKFTGNNMRRVGFEGDTKITEDLAPLVTTVLKSKNVDFHPINGVSNALACNIPSNWLYYVSSSVLFKYIDGSVIKVKNLPARFIDHKVADKFYSTSYNMPWIKGAVCYSDAGYYSLNETLDYEQPQSKTLTFLYDLFEINLFLEGRTNHSESILLTYIRRPALFLLEGSVDPDDPEQEEDPDQPVLNLWVIGDILCTRAGLNMPNMYNIYTALVDVDHGINIAYNYTTNTTDIVNLRYEKIGGSGDIIGVAHADDGSLGLTVDGANVTVKIIAYINDSDDMIYKEKAFLLSYTAPKVDSGLVFPAAGETITQRAESGLIYIINPNNIDVSDIDVSIEGESITVDEVILDLLSYEITISYNIILNGRSIIKASFEGNNLYNPTTIRYTVNVDLPDEVNYIWSGFGAIAGLHFSDPTNVCQLPQIRLKKYVNGEYIEDVPHTCQVMSGAEYCSVLSNGGIDTITIKEAAKTLSKVLMQADATGVNRSNIFNIYVLYTDTVLYTLNPIARDITNQEEIQLYSRKTDSVTSQNQIRWELIGEGDILNYFTIHSAPDTLSFFYAKIKQIDGSHYDGTKNIQVKLSVVANPNVFETFIIHDVTYTKKNPRINPVIPDGGHFTIRTGEIKVLHLFNNLDSLPITVTSDYDGGMNTNQISYSDITVNVPVICYLKGAVTFTAKFEGNDEYNAIQVKSAWIYGEDSTELGGGQNDRVYMFAIGHDTGGYIHPGIGEIIPTPEAFKPTLVAAAGGLSMALMPLTLGSLKWNITGSPSKDATIEISPSSQNYIISSSVRYSFIENYCMLLYRSGWGGGAGSGYGNAQFSVIYNNNDIKTQTDFTLKGGLDELEGHLYGFDNPSQVIRIPHSGLAHYLHIYKYPYTFQSVFYFERIVPLVFDYRLYFWDCFGSGLYKTDLSQYWHQMEYVDNFITTMDTHPINSVVDEILFSVSQNKSPYYRDALITLFSESYDVISSIHFILEYKSDRRIYFMPRLVSGDMYFDKGYTPDTTSDSGLFASQHPDIIFQLGNSRVIGKFDYETIESIDELNYEIDVNSWQQMDVAYPKSILDYYDILTSMSCSDPIELLWGDQTYIKITVHNTSHTAAKIIFSYKNE